jgi:HAMP domain-containing protein
VKLTTLHLMRKFYAWLSSFALKSKGATGENNEFSPDNPDIRFREQDNPGQWQSTEPGLLDDVIYKLQHKQIDTRRTVQAITKAIGDIADKYNPELKESLYHGRAANETRKFLDFELRPLTRRMIALGVDTPTLEAFLWARHAEERNAHIAKINPRMPDGGSGLTNAQAKQLLAGNDVTINGETIAGVPQSKLDELGELSAMADAMLDKSRELLVENGLETRATIDVWKSDYPHYVPLHREEFEDDRMTGRGLGMSVKGPSGKRAIGSDKPVGNILAAIVSQRELYITRAEKNRVGNALYGLATTAPNEEFWKAVDPAANANRDAEALWAQIKQRMTKLASMPNGDPDLEAIIDGMKAQHKAMMKKAIPGMKKVVDSLVSLGLPAEMAERVLAEPKELAINPRTGMVVERVNPLLRHLDNVVATRINGRDVFVVFDARDKRASRMAIAMKNLDADQLGFLLGNMAKATRYFAAINTQFNPIFGVTNFVRDIQTAMLNLSSTPLADHKKEVATRSLSAMRGIYSDLRAHRAGNLPSSKWAAMFERFKQAGGATGYRDMFETLSDRSKDLQDELKKMSMSKGRRLFTLGQSNPVFAWLSDYNEMMENSVRVAAFSVGIEQGLSDDKAASLAKELTVNFNKKGQVAAQAGAMYAFFNAAVQGSARIAQTLFVNRDGKVSLSSAGKKIVSGGIMLGVAQAFLGALAGWDDEEPPQFVRERSLIIPLGDHYFSVPMPLGFNVLPNIGRITAEFAMSGFKDPAKRIGSLLNVLADTLNPIGNAGVSLQTIAPTVIDPLAALAENKDWTGKPIKRMSFNEEAAGYKNAKDTATVWSKWIAEGLNYLSGGTEHKAGLSSPTPDQIDYLIGQVTGGVGREISKAVQSSTSVFSGEDLPLYKVPLVGKFVGDTKGNAADASRFYANVRDLKAHKAELDGRRKAGQDVAEYLRDNPDARLVVLASRIERRVQELRRAKRELIDQGAPKDRVKQAEDQIAALMKALNNRVQANQRAA